MEHLGPYASETSGSYIYDRYNIPVKVSLEYQTSVCESKSRSQRDLDLTCRVESVSHSNCVVIQKDHVLFGAL